ncbi:mitochondrial coenzyme A diphosphatase NUDT8 isoform 2-T2 [Pholidichthys leucotaenia]
MLRGFWILAWPCHGRSLHLLRGSRLSASFGNVGAEGLDARCANEKQYDRNIEKGRSTNGSPMGNLCCSTILSFISSKCDRYQLRKTLLEDLLSKASVLDLYHPQGLAKTKKVFNPVKDSQDYLINTICLQSKSSSGHFPQHSLSCTSKIQCHPLQSHLNHRPQFVRPFSFLTHMPQILGNFLKRPPPYSLYSCQTIATHQAAPYVADTLRDCLSPDNENRCRQSLGPNLKLYETQKVKKLGIQSQKRWASVLVSLCSVQGEPAFLFTLRSSTLKGRHKGDVSFAGGKSDPSDRDVVSTALREAREELGINVGAKCVWGVLKPLREFVEEIFTLSLSHLCNPLNQGYTHFRTGDKYGYTLPVFRNGKHRVWGLTAMALDHTLKLIVSS